MFIAAAIDEGFRAHDVKTGDRGSYPLDFLLAPEGIQSNLDKVNPRIRVFRKRTFDSRRGPGKAGAC